MLTVVPMFSVCTLRSPLTCLDLKMLKESDFIVWRAELRKFLHQWVGEGAAPANMTNASEGSPASGTSLALMDHADGLLESSIQSLSQLNASQNSLDIKNVIVALKQLQEQHGLIRQQLVRRPREGLSRSGTPANAGFLSPPSPGRDHLMAAGMSLRNSNGSVSPSFMDDGDHVFYDADDMMDGVEFEMRGEDEEQVDIVYDDDDDDDDYDDGRIVDAADDSPVNTVVPSQRSIVYRTELPAPVTGEELSLFSILKKNVGKDLSTISFPVTFNCPLSLLQAAAEEYEYAPNLLERAAQSSDSVERMLLVGAFSVSSYASTAHRTTRKPFNPLLGETFECVRADRDMHFIAEKVVHRPPVVASYCFGKGWKVSSAVSVKNKFWGKSLEFIAEGAQIVELNSGDKYSISKPSSFMRNLLAGNKYLEHVGEMVITNLRTDERLVIQFKEGTLFGGPANRNHIEGTMYDRNNGVMGTIKGKWDEQVARVMGKDHLQVLWEVDPLPPNPARYYGFTRFAISLNEITEDIKDVLPPTDTRLRPDQRALEQGDADRAEELKLVLENEQRERRKQLEESGQEYEPQWFHPGSDGLDWVYGSSDGREYFRERTSVERGHATWNVRGASIFQH